MTDAVLLVAHGTVESLADMPAFLANIRRGHPAPPELVAELVRRYEAIGGSSPLNAINRKIAQKVEDRLGVPTRLANRLWAPYPKDVLAQLRDLGATRVAAVPLAQHSAHVYREAVVQAAAPLGLEARCAEDWGQTPALVSAYAARIRAARAKLGGSPAVLMTAHSLPRAVIDAGDPYEREVRASAEAIAQEIDGSPWMLEFQSQGMSTGPGGRPMAWLGRGIRPALEELAGKGERSVVLAPIGFLADHVEILYDVDVEAAAWAKELGLAFARTASLNADDDLLSVIADMAKRLLR